MDKIVLPYCFQKISFPSFLYYSGWGG